MPWYMMMGTSTPSCAGPSAPAACVENSAALRHSAAAQTAAITPCFVRICQVLNMPTPRPSASWLKTPYSCIWRTGAHLYLPSVNTAVLSRRAAAARRVSAPPGTRTAAAVSRDVPPRHKKARAYQKGSFPFVCTGVLCALSIGHSGPCTLLPTAASRRGSAAGSARAG